MEFIMEWLDKIIPNEPSLQMSEIYSDLGTGMMGLGITATLQNDERDSRKVNDSGMQDKLSPEGMQNRATSTIVSRGPQEADQCRDPVRP